LSIKIALRSCLVKTSLPFKFTTWIGAHKAGARNPGGASPADVASTDLMAVPATALPQAFSISYLKRVTVYHDRKAIFLLLAK
jgi:hypothetical protein